VTADFIRDVQSRGIKDSTVDDLIDMRRRGLPRKSTM
jgi:hypothetical protein